MAKSGNGAASAKAATKRTRNTITVTGSTVDVSGVSFSGSKSKYEQEVEKLIDETNASDTPEGVGRFYADKKVVSAIKAQAFRNKVHVQVANANGGYVVRIDPDQSKPFTKKTRAPRTGVTETQPAS
jgi:hypothetical protein